MKVTERRTSQDWALFIRELVDTHYPKAEKIVLVMDNLNTHTPSSLYQTLSAFRGTPSPLKARDSLHPSAWQLVEHGRN